MGQGNKTNTLDKFSVIIKRYLRTVKRQKCAMNTLLLLAKAS